MATRGFVGFYTEGITKGVYHHSDADIDALGHRLGEYLAQTDLTKLNRRAREWMKYAESYPGLSFRDGPVILEWAELQRRLEDDTADLTKGENADFSFFLYRRIFCEYAYILNLDTQELEIYRGGSTLIEQVGRYVAVPPEWEAEVNSLYADLLDRAVSHGIPKEEAVKVTVRDGGVSKVLAIPFTVLAYMNHNERRRFMLFLQWIHDAQAERDTIFFFQENSRLLSQYGKQDAEQFPGCYPGKIEENITMQSDSGEPAGVKSDNVEKCAIDEEDESEECYRQMVKKAMKKTAPVSGMERASQGKKKRRTTMDGIKLVQVGV